MSKTFRSVHNDLHDMEVDAHPDGSVRFSVDADYFVGFCAAPSDAPALALAILEAAGVEATPMATSVAFGTVVADLQRLIAEQERATAEARERSELESEALKFYLTFHSAVDRPCQDWDYLDQQDKQQWLAVARRARELAKEATK